MLQKNTGKFVAETAAGNAVKSGGLACVTGIKAATAAMKNSGVELKNVLGKEMRKKMGENAAARAEAVKEASAHCAAVAKVIAGKCGSAVTTTGNNAMRRVDDAIDVKHYKGLTEKGSKIVTEGAIDIRKEKITDEEKGNFFDILKAAGTQEEKTKVAQEMETLKAIKEEIKGKGVSDFEAKLSACQKEVKEGLKGLTTTGSATMWTAPLIGETSVYNVRDSFAELYAAAEEFADVYTVLENIQLAYETLDEMAEI